MKIKQTILIALLTMLAGIGGVMADQQPNLGSVSFSLGCTPLQAGILVHGEPQGCPHIYAPI